jgi:hypothetical protein
VFGWSRSVYVLSCRPTVTYDLVASLRASAEWIKDIEHESWFDTADLQNDAADVIERLRAAGDALAIRLRWWTDDTDASYPDHEALRTWEQARRG